MTGSAYIDHSDRVAVSEFWIIAFPHQSALCRLRRTDGLRFGGGEPLPKDFPGAPAENLVAGPPVFTMTPGPVDLRSLKRWLAWTRRLPLAAS